MTVAHTLSVLSYHIIANSKITQKLQEELEAAFRKFGTPTWSQLEQLPYLVSISWIAVFNLSPASRLTSK